ncbi:hypothetical protein PCANC_19569 [Puccinia coronata f. sp. avenae]|uniref:ARID domain-containing protein n=1 Tax=Puccinia coronata f. sp. avenae TaxID=200324 RepID=A0A2N5SAQ1_9BASI|nr:hypothetical protein PCASD_25456 [Puccinia coronata f. sp. avenae]PLW32723.1 hypothetical protein PCANC_19569 [Puccinia coronata f. sp. avenae]PLW38428.1 hypothetical protein PCASD_10341 [Puccinia coronata f. sp. avenae]
MSHPNQQNQQPRAYWTHAHHLTWQTEVVRRPPASGNYASLPASQPLLFQQQSQAQLTRAPHHLGANTSFQLVAVTPQQYIRQISHGGQQLLVFQGSPALVQRVATGPIEPRRPPARMVHPVLQYSPGASSSPHLDPLLAGRSSSSPNVLTAYNPPATWVRNITAHLDIIAPDSFAATVGDHLRRKGLWNGPPLFRGKELDLFKVWSTCLKAGGFDRVTAVGLWGHIAVEMDGSINASDHNDVQPAAYELWELYRFCCLDSERAFWGILAQVERDRHQTHSIAPVPSQAFQTAGLSHNYARPSSNPSTNPSSPR